MRIDAHPMRIGRCIRMANPSGDGGDGGGGGETGGGDGGGGRGGCWVMEGHFFN